ncbi:hypothetical protein KM043_008134 [Ampulex compressa]|nr:hypothetical protein KM043_008134 [Ampulex compressa]
MGEEWNLGIFYLESRLSEKYQIQNETRKGLKRLLQRAGRVKGGKDKSFLVRTFDGQTDPVFGKAWNQPGPFKEMPRAQRELFLRLMPANGLFALKIFHPLPALNNLPG